MKLGRIADGLATTAGLPARWLTRLFFSIWTVLVVLTVWWLVAGNSDRADLLIALDRSDAGSWVTQARGWVETHVEVYWVYPWILLAPYVLWLGLKVTVEKYGLTWRLALHFAVGAGFIYASQALTHRLEALRPKALFLREEEVVRRVTKEGTNEPTTVALTRTIEWHGRVVRTESNEVFGDPLTPKAMPTPRRGTNLSPSGAVERTKVIVLRTEADQMATATSAMTNQVVDPALSNETARDLASRLAPLIEEQMKGLRGPQAAGTRKLTAVLDGLAYFALIGLAQAIHFRRRLSERESQAALLESKLSQSRLHALQAQLQPHFLFNTLNGIALLVRRDPRIAEEMLTSLSELLRVSLAQSGRQEIPLRDELHFLDRYLELQQMRFGDRLRVERHIDSTALNCLVPSLLLQPLVENAIRHGIEPSPNPGLVCIEVERRNGHLLLAVEDNGVGLDGRKGPVGTSGNGIGLNSVRERLAGLYGECHEFAFQEKPAGGVSVRMKIPVRMATEPPPSRAVRRPHEASSNHR